MVAHPCFITKSLRIQEFSFFNASSLCSLSPSCWNLATQIGARTSSTAASAWTPACFSALPADIHPNPALSTIHHTTAPPATLHSTVFTVCHLIAHLFSARMLALITRPHGENQQGPCFQECSVTWPRGQGRPACACILPSASPGTLVMETFSSCHPCTS